jgi:hypothetical protein
LSFNNGVGFADQLEKKQSDFAYRTKNELDDLFFANETSKGVEYGKSKISKFPLAK